MLPGTFARPNVQHWLTARLEEVRRTGTGRLLAIRGRRQAGKSTAVETFVETSSLPYVYVTGMFHVPAREQLAAASDALAASRMPLPTQLPEPASTWREWFTRLALAASSEPIIVVLDEFPWIQADDSAKMESVEGTLQIVWDRMLEKLPVLLILIGSDMAMMERLAQHDRPLFGRVREFVVPMLTPGEVASAIPRSSAAETFDDWLVTGGYPRLVVELRDAKLDVRDWVRRSFMDEFSPLVATARLSLDAEFRDSLTASMVLSTIGSAEPAHLQLGQIVDAIRDGDDAAARKRTQTTVLRALRVLADEKRLIAADLPAWATSTRLRRYRVTDTYLRFWFRYVQRYQDVIARGRGDLAFAGFERDWSSWRGRAIEPMVRESLERLATTDARLHGVESVHAWWTRDGRHEVDVVAADRERTLLIATVKWRERGGVTRHDMHILAEQRSLIPRAALAELAAVCPSGSVADGFPGFSADDLLGAWKRPAPGWATH